jgi:hypothetical protein
MSGITHPAPPCIDCIILPKCRALLNDGLNIYLLMDRCSLLDDYVYEDDDDDFRWQRAVNAAMYLTDAYKMYEDAYKRALNIKEKLNEIKS